MLSIAHPVTHNDGRRNIILYVTRSSPLPTICLNRDTVGDSVLGLPHPWNPPRQSLRLLYLLALPF
jgi:hypothetical protein